MAESRLIQKQLAGKEDLLLGVGKVKQVRASGIKDITKLNATHFGGVLVVDTINDLNSLDKNQLDEQVVFVKETGNTYSYNGTSWVNKTAITVENIEDLATYTGLGSAIVKDINRGGVFVSKTEVDIDPNTGSLYTVNDGTVFAKTGGGFWVRQYSGAINVKWFGAKGDGVSDDTEAIQKAVALSKGVIYVKGTYVISDTITITGDSVEIKATNAQINWAGTNTNPIYKLQAPISGVTINGGTYTGNASAFLLAIGVTPDVTKITDYARFVVNNVNVAGMGLFIDAQKAARYKVTQCQTYTKSGINNEGKIVEVKISDSVIYSSSGREPGTYGIRSILHPDTTVTGKYPEGLHVTNSTIDTFGDDLLYNDIFTSFISNVYISTITVHGNNNIYSTLCRDINISNCYIGGQINLKQKIGGGTSNYYFLASGNEFNKFLPSGPSVLIENNVKRVSILNNNFFSGKNTSAILGGANNDYIVVSGNTCDSTYSRLYANNGTGGLYQAITNNVDNGPDGSFSATPAYFRDNLSSKKRLFTQIIPQTILKDNMAIESLQFNAVKGENFLLIVSMNCLAASAGYLRVNLNGTATMETSSGSGFSDGFKQLPTSSISALSFAMPIYCSSSGGCTINFTVSGSTSLAISYHSVATLFKI